MNSNLDNIFYIINNVNPDNKLAVLWFKIKQRIKYLIPHRIEKFYRTKIRTLYKPFHSRIRRAIPRYWYDLDYIAVMVNFEIIKSFYEDEYKDGQVDWKSDDGHIEFSKWLERAYKYITKERPALEKKIENAYPDLSTHVSGKTAYKKLYGKVDKLEKELFDKDSEVIIEMIKRRQYLWT
jgi:hypothetical protein